MLEQPRDADISAVDYRDCIQVCVQLHTSADNVALPAFAAARRAAARLLLSTGPQAVQ